MASAVLREGLRVVFIIYNLREQGCVPPTTRIPRGGSHTVSVTSGNGMDMFKFSLGLSNPNRVGIGEKWRRDVNRSQMRWGGHCGDLGQQKIKKE